MLNRRDLMVGAAASALVVPGLSLGATATDFSLRNLLNKEISLGDFAGKVVFLSFWAQWCGPCKVEMKHLHAFHKELNDKGLQVLFVSIDEARARMAVKQYVKKNRYNEELYLLDPQSEVVSLYNPKKSVPFGVLVGRNRQVVKLYEGFNPGEEVEVKETIMHELEKSA